ncbi:MAG: hypothetical protein ACE5HE_03730 [Phycisphaerae bacterium]
MKHASDRRAVVEVIPLRPAGNLINPAQGGRFQACFGWIITGVCNFGFYLDRVLPALVLPFALFASFARWRPV